MDEPAGLVADDAGGRFLLDGQRDERNRSVDMITGGCLCEGVRYQVDGPLRDAINCFCDQCRKTSGHYVAAASARHEDFELLRDETLEWYESSETARRGFCRRCGGNLFWQKYDRDSISIFAGTIDPPTGIRTAENIFVDSKSDYHALPELT